MAADYWNRLLTKQLGRRRLLALAGSAGAVAVVAACGGKSPAQQNGNESTSAGTTTPTAEVGVDIARPDGWEEASHASSANPDYATVFPSDRVNQLTIVIAPDEWEAMLANMTTLFGARGSGSGTGGGGAPGGAGGGGQPPAGGGAGGRGGDLTPENPQWALATIQFNGRTWTNVGVRFKGNSSLRSSWSSGTDRLPFKLDFDEFEDQFLEIKNQRFHGFKQLSLANNFGDPSHMRETPAYDIFEGAGLVAANTALYELILDRGEGPTSLGLYTVIEVIDDTVISRFFEDATGNIYEADGTAASFAQGTSASIETSFEAEGGDAADWSDIKELYTVLHSSERAANQAAWRAALEAVFEVDVFLRWLGLSAAIQHWDTYGAMNHNYYLYNNPESGRLTWISWDHNFVLGASAGGGGAARGGGNGGPGGMSTALDKSNVGDEWPLIAYLLDQDEYQERYMSFLRESLSVFNSDALEARCRSMETFTSPHVTDSAAFGSAVDALVEAIRSQEQAVRDFVSA